MQELSKETIIYKFSIGEIDILPVELFPEFLTIVNSMAQAKKVELEDKKILGLPVKRMAILSKEAEMLIRADEYTQASLRLRELYNILNF